MLIRSRSQSLVFVVVALVAVLALVATGCGDDSESSSEATTTTAAAADVEGDPELCEELSALQTEYAMGTQAEYYREAAELADGEVREAALRVADLADESEQRWPGSTSGDPAAAEGAVPPEDLEEYEALLNEAMDDMSVVWTWQDGVCGADPAAGDEFMFDENGEPVFDGEMEFDESGEMFLEPDPNPAGTTPEPAS